MKLGLAMMFRKWCIELNRISNPYWLTYWRYLFGITMLLSMLLSMLVSMLGVSMWLLMPQWRVVELLGRRQWQRLVGVWSVLARPRNHHRRHHQHHHHQHHHHHPQAITKKTPTSQSNLTAPSQSVRATTHGTLRRRPSCARHYWNWAKYWNRWTVNYSHWKAGEDILNCRRRTSWTHLRANNWDWDWDWDHLPTKPWHPWTNLWRLLWLDPLLLLFVIGRRNTSRTLSHNCTV